MTVCLFYWKKGKKASVFIDACGTPAMGICSLQTGDQDSPHCVGPPSSQIPLALNEGQQRY